jgi:uncharacterized protein YdeI (YjbR/CyaY-like superfamily)
MGKKDRRIDAYIRDAQPFAQPILTHVRALVHRACPEVEETIKWGFPHFGYKGMMFSMASFKEHCAMGFWKAGVLPDPDGILQVGESASAMGNLGRVTTTEDLPSDRILVKYIKAAAALNDEGVRAPAKSRRPDSPVVVPAYFMTALKKNAAALATFKNFSPSNKREYIEWVTGAKTEETRLRRLATAVEWMAEGKPQNWRYAVRK